MFDSKGVGEVVDLSGEFTEGDGRGKGPAVRVFRFPSQIDTKSVDEQLTQLKGGFAHQGLAVDAEPSSLAFQDVAGVEVSDSPPTSILVLGCVFSLWYQAGFIRSWRRISRGNPPESSNSSSRPETSAPGAGCPYRCLYSPMSKGSLKVSGQPVSRSASASRRSPNG